jgi:ribosomal protein L29
MKKRTKFKLKLSDAELEELADAIEDELLLLRMPQIMEQAKTQKYIRVGNVLDFIAKM